MRGFAVLIVSVIALGQEPRPIHPTERPPPPQPTQRSWSATEHHLPPPADLSPAVRNLLRERMGRHGKTMSELVQAVIVLDYAQTVRLAREIAEEPQLARPLSHDATELNSSLPEEFFQLQQELHMRASSLAEAARTRNGAEMAPAFGKLAETCVACHRTYSTGR
jgi:hypothetical protein